MYFYTFILILLSTSYVVAQNRTMGKCLFWGDPHLSEFPANAQQAGVGPSYWCTSSGRILILKNAFIKFYVTVTAAPYLIEYYEIQFLLNGSMLCTITADNENCSREFVTINGPLRGSATVIRIKYQLADDMDIVIQSQLYNNQKIYNIDVQQSDALIRASTGLCITRGSDCILETAGRRKRSTSEAVASDVCDIFVAEANKTAKQLTGGVKSQMISKAREACITDVLLTNNIAWGESAVWLVLVDSIQLSGLSTVEQTELMMNISSSIAETVANAKPKVESIIGNSTTSVSSDTTESMMTTLTTNSSFNINQIKHNLILLLLIALAVCSTLY